MVQVSSFVVQDIIDSYARPAHVLEGDRLYAPIEKAQVDDPKSSSEKVGEGDEVDGVISREEAFERPAK